eukprot:3570286-Prymnesium_polylepis.1
MVSLEALEEDNARAARSGDPLLYNELSLAVRSIRGLCAVFVRSSAPADVLFAAGVRALLQHIFPSLPPLPLLRITADGGASILSRHEQLELLRTTAATSPRVAQHRLP